jgi:AcrR family transcriptional regulator
VRLTRPERSERILDTSQSLFARKGFAATKTKDIARAAGVSEAMVFKLFPDKEGLYRALIERKIADAEKVMPLAELAASEDPPERFFGRIAGLLFERVEEDPSFLRLLLFSALEDHPLSAEFDQARAEGLRRAIESYVVRQQRRGVLKRMQPKFASRAFMGLVGSFLQARTIFREPGAKRFSRDALAKELVGLFLGGMKRP